MISDFQNEMNLKQMKDLQDRGYKFEITSNGYTVWCKEEFVGGAGVKLPRESKSRRNAIMIKADLRDYTQSAISTANRHLAKNQ
jgi:hypothetical protein